jgi:hypothetical protein
MKIDRWTKLENEMQHRGFTFANAEQHITESHIKIQFQCQNVTHPPLVTTAWRFINGTVCPHCKAELLVAIRARKQNAKTNN